MWVFVFFVWPKPPGERTSGRLGRPSREASVVLLTDFTWPDWAVVPLHMLQSPQQCPEGAHLLLPLKLLTWPTLHCTHRNIGNPHCSTSTSQKKTLHLWLDPQILFILAEKSRTMIPHGVLRCGWSPLMFNVGEEIVASSLFLVHFGPQRNTYLWVACDEILCRHSWPSENEPSGFFWSLDFTFRATCCEIFMFKTWPSYVCRHPHVSEELLQSIKRVVAIVVAILAVVLPPLPPS